MQRRSLTILVLAGLLLAAPVQAEDVSGRLGLGLELGYMKLMGGQFDYSNIDQEWGLHARYGLAPHWSLQLGLNSGWVHPKSDVPEPNSVRVPGVDRLYTVRWSTRLDALYHLRPSHHVSPYLGLGLGLTHLDVKDMRGRELSGLYPSGPTVWGYEEDCNRRELKFLHITFSGTAGLDWFATPSLAFNLGARASYMENNKRDNIGLSADDFYGPCQAVDANDWIVEGFLGFTYFLGSTDRDGDGIKNDVDACPDTPEDLDGHQDLDGCPDLDNDGDGVADDADQCPEESEDYDGYQDDDGCPDLDNDGDGILDRRDDCPDQAEDFDGFEDGDGCPELDNDEDGVPDAGDNCPGTPADVEVDEFGCPVVEEITEALILQGVTFANNSAQLLDTSEAVLDEVAQSLLAWPNVIIEVHGHTDNRGRSGHNFRLSEQRAEAVRDYLIQRGVDRDRITARGFGERNPIADNETAEGRAMNRRVELHRVGG